MKKLEKQICLLVIVVLVFCIVGVYYLYQDKQNTKLGLINNKAHMSYITNILKETAANTYFRKVLFTGTRSQLVVMDIPPGGEVGEEIHKYTEQTLFFLSGTGKAIFDGKESSINAGDVVVITPGTKHNFVNTGTNSLKIYTVYAPPNHIDGRIHITEADSDADTLDEAVDESNSLR